MKNQTALSFYKSIQKEEDKYRLVNGLFITKYLDKDLSVYIGEFLKRGTARNESKTNQVKISKQKDPQLFNKKENLTTTGIGMWKKLSIGLIEKPIKEILK